MTATTRSVSITPSSMSLASSEASLTLCSGILRTSIGAGTSFLSTREQDGADVVARDGVGDVLEGRHDGAARGSGAMSRALHEAERGLDLGTQIGRASCRERV